MSPECVIGVDLGGTKLLAGVVDADLNVHHRVHRSVHGLGQRELLDMAVEAVEEARAAATSEVAAVGFGIPCLIDQRRGMATMAVNLPLRDVPFRDLMAERLGLPVEVDNDANVAAIAEWRAGAARGHERRGRADDRHRHRRWADPRRGAVPRGRSAQGRSWVTSRSTSTGRHARATARTTAAWRRSPPARALAREGKRIAGEQPDSALGHAYADGREITGALITELAHDGDAAAIEALTLIGTNLGIGIASYMNVFNPDVVVIGGGVIAAGELLLAPARAEAVRRALPTMSAPRADRARRSSAPRRGSSAPPRSRSTAPSGAWREDSPLMAGRLIVCPTPIGNLEDVTLRVLSALREADLIACEDTRRTRTLLDRYGVSSELLSYHEHNERERASELVRRMQAGANVALVSDAGMPLVSDPGFLLVQACVAAGLGGRGAAGTERGARGAGGERAAGRALALRRLPAAQAGRAENARSRTPETLVAFESPKRVAASLAVLAEVDPERPVAVCRELTKLHEEVVRGTAAELAARYAEEAPRGEVVLVIGAADEAEAPLAPALDALRRLVDAGAKPRPAATVVAELTGVPANALYKALTATLSRTRASAADD